MNFLVFFIKLSMFENSGRYIYIPIHTVYYVQYIYPLVQWTPPLGWLRGFSFYPAIYDSMQWVRDRMEQTNLHPSVVILCHLHM